MSETYPLALRTVLASKSRSQPASFVVAEPRRGYGYAQAVGTDVPVFWDVQFRFTQPEAIRFMLWFTQVLQRGLREFTIPLRTEFGVLLHTCRFLDEDLLPATIAAGVYSYSAKIMARAQVIPTGFLDAAEIIVAEPDWEGLGELLDLAVAGAP